MKWNSKILKTFNFKSSQREYQATCPDESLSKYIQIEILLLSTLTQTILFESDVTGKGDLILDCSHQFSQAKVD